MSLFSGVGGMDLGLEAAGWTCVAQVEWDPHCQAVLARHWPDVPRWGDVTTVHGADLPPAELVAFGSPCQDLSVAGKRAGFDGERSVLFYQACRIIREMRDATDGRYPTWVVWENVAGALSSSGGRDFAAVLDELADLGAVDICWRVLDARWFGVPQRRRRVFVVADLAGERAAAVLPEPAGVSWHPRTGTAARADLAAGAAGGDGSGRTVGALTARCGNTQDDTQTTQLVAALTSNGVGTCGPDDNQAQAGRTLDLSIRGRDGGAQVEITEELANALRAGDGGSSRSRAIMHVAALTSNGVGTCGPDNNQAQAGHQVRRLTPVECERLMGWPDDHTRWRADGTEVADTHRYRQCGNGVAAPVAEWLGWRLAQAVAE